MQGGSIQGAYHPLAMYQALFGVKSSFGRLRSTSMDAVIEVSSAKTRKRFSTLTQRIIRHRRNLSNVEISISGATELRNASKHIKKVRQVSSAHSKSPIIDLKLSEDTSLSMTSPLQFTRNSEIDVS